MEHRSVRRIRRVRRCLPEAPLSAPEPVDLPQGEGGNGVKLHRRRAELVSASIPQNRVTVI